jgi:hypothetical protein
VTAQRLQLGAWRNPGIATVAQELTLAIMFSQKSALIDSPRAICRDFAG